MYATDVTISIKLKNYLNTFLSDFLWRLKPFLHFKSGP